MRRAISKPPRSSTQAFLGAGGRQAKRSKDPPTPDPPPKTHTHTHTHARAHMPFDPPPLVCSTYPSSVLLQSPLRYWPLAHFMLLHAPHLVVECLTSLMKVPLPHSVHLYVLVPLPQAPE